MIIAYDTETYKFNESTNTYKPILNAREFKIGYVETDKDKGNGKYFYDHEKMYKYIINKIEKNSKQKRATYTYAHNAEYDWYAIAKDHLMDKKIKYILFHPFLTIYDDRAYFLDSSAFYRMTLEKLGETLGFKKLEMPKEIKEIDELKEYVKRDTQIVLKSILSLKKRLNELGYNPRKLLTSGQLAMTCFLTYCKREKIEKYFMEWNNERNIMQVVKCKNKEKVRQAYRGGDNQAYKIGKFENVTLIDMVGMYGKIMEDFEFPDLRSENLQVKPTKEMFLKYIEKQIGVARIIINAPSTNHPVLPIRFGEYQIFPSATRLKGTWTFIEIKQALLEGYKLEKIEWCVRWNKLEVKGVPLNPFNKFIKNLHKIERESKTKEEKGPIKMIRNNLTGKWGQNRKNKDVELVERYKVMNYIEKGYKSIGKFNDKYIVEIQKDDYEPSYVNVIISAYITAKGRLKIHEEEKKVPFENRLYKDTDSLMFIDKTGEIIKKFKIGEMLGDWKIEGQNEKCKILGEKRYYFGDEVKISGVHKNKRTKNVIENEENINIDRIYGLKSAMMSGEWDKVGTFENIEMEMKPHSKNMLPIPDYIDETNL